MTRSGIRNSRGAFTLVEILIVIGVLAGLISVVVVILNPVEFLRQSRDARRFSDMGALDKALSLHEIDRPSGSTGDAATVYVSVPDSSGTCVNLGLPSLPAGWSYGCVASSTLQNVDGSGWIPVDLTEIHSGSPLGVLPVDPVNSTSTGLYYTYVPGGSFEVNAMLEAEKYRSGGDKERTTADGGDSIGLLEFGSDLAVSPLKDTNGIVGWWKFDEGGGSTAQDSSGNGHNGSWSGPGTRYAEGKVGSYAGNFEGGTNYVSVSPTPDLNSFSAFTISAWVNPASGFSENRILYVSPNGANGYYFQIWASRWFMQTHTSSGWQAQLAPASPAPRAGEWTHVVTTWDGSTHRLYIDNEEVASGSATGLISGAATAYIGSAGGGNSFVGQIDDVRVYNRALSLAEISAIYNGTN